MPYASREKRIERCRQYRIDHKEELKKKRELNWEHRNEVKRNYQRRRAAEKKAVAKNKIKIYESHREFRRMIRTIRVADELWGTMRGADWFIFGVRAELAKKELKIKWKNRQVNHENNYKLESITASDKRFFQAINIGGNKMKELEEK